jgi:hypothetical protein
MPLPTANGVISFARSYRPFGEELVVAHRLARYFGAIAVLAAANMASASLIGANFVATNDGGVQDAVADALAVDELAGAPDFEQVNWNNLGRWGSSVGVKDSTGAASGVLVTWDANNTWNTGAGTTTPNRKLMNGYIDALGLANVDTEPYGFWSNDNKPQAFVTGLSAWLAAQGQPAYDVIVYTDGDAREGRKSEYWLQEASGGNPPTTLGADLTPHVFAMDPINFQDTDAFTQIPLSANSVDDAAEGNYIVFKGLTADSFLLRTEEQTFRATINGFQIVAVPEPASIGLLGLGAIGLLVRRRPASS